MSDPYLNEHAMSEQALSEQSDSHLTHKGLLKLIEGRVSADARRQAFDHMRRCDGCARQFENAVMAERLLAGDATDDSPVPLPELDTLLPAILDEAVPAPTRRSPWLMAIPALAMAAAVFVAVGLDGAAPSEGDIVITPGEGDETSSGFKTRGNGEDAAAKASKGSLDLICIDSKGRPAELKSGGRCAVGSELYVAVKPVPDRGALRLKVTDAKGQPVAVIHATEEADAKGVSYPVADYAAAVTKQTEGMADLVVKLSGAVLGTLTLTAEVCDDCHASELAKPATDGAPRRRHEATVTVIAAAQQGGAQ